MGFTGVGVEPGGGVHGEDRDPGLVDGVHEAAPFGIQGAFEADAEEAFDDERVGQREEGSEFLEPGGGLADVDQGDFAFGQVLDNLAGVVAIVAFAGEHEDGVAGSGELANPVGDDVPDAADDFERGAFGRPGELLPFPHLGHADHGDWHGWEYAECTDRCQPQFALSEFRGCRMLGSWNC